MADEISDGWDETSDAFDELDDVPHEVIDQAGAERDLAIGELEVAYWTAHHETMAAAANVTRERALAVDAKSHTCANCGALLDKVRPVSEALNVECGYCQAVNTVDPGDALRSFAGFGAMWIAEGHALPAWQRMKRAELSMESYRDKKDVPMATLEAFDAAARAYWTTRFGIEAEFVPELKKHVAGKVDANLKTANKTLRQYWQWRERQDG